MTLSAVTIFKIKIKIVFFPRIESELAILGNQTIDFCHREQRRLTHEE